jgi:hypothetical protein
MVGPAITQPAPDHCMDRGRISQMNVAYLLPEGVEGLHRLADSVVALVDARPAGCGGTAEGPVFRYEDRASA